jgi:ubiquitin C-terminal hydrolase
MKDPEANKPIISYIDSIVGHYVQLNVVTHKDALNNAFARLISMYKQLSTELTEKENPTDIVFDIFDQAFAGTLILDPKEIDYIKNYNRPFEEIAQKEETVCLSHEAAVKRSTDVFSVNGNKVKHGRTKTSWGCGLNNYGDSCYVNAIIQTLYACYEREPDFCKNSVAGNTLLTALCETFTQMDAKSYLDEVPFTDELKARGEKNGGAMPCYNSNQEDAGELFRTFVGGQDVFKSRVDKLFSIETQETAKCFICGRETVRLVNDTHIAVSIESDNLNDCILDYKRGGREQNCENPSCLGKDDLYHTTYSLFTDVSKFLVIQLKRFAYDYATEKTHKIKSFVKFDDTLRIDGLKFALFAVVNHIGKAVKCGHYTTYTKDTKGAWYLCNDRTIDPVNFPSEVVTPEAYMLFYEVITS